MEGEGSRLQSLPQQRPGAFHPAEAGRWVSGTCCQPKHRRFDSRRGINVPLLVTGLPWG